MARQITIQVPLNPIQINLLQVIADLIEHNARSPNSEKKGVTIYQLDKSLPYDKQTIKINLYKLKELKNVS